MGGHFSIDVDVPQLRRAQRRMGNHAATLSTREKQARGAPARWAPHWKGRAASHISAQARDLCQDTRDLVDDLEQAADAVKVFANRLDEALDVELPDLNARWEAAEKAYDAAHARATKARSRATADIPADATDADRLRLDRNADRALGGAISAAGSTLASARQKLEEEYDDLLADLRRAARRLSRALASTVPLPLDAEKAGHFTQRAIDGHPMGTLPTDQLWDELQKKAEDEFGGPSYELMEDLRHPSNDLGEVEAALARARELGLEPLLYREALEHYWFLEAALAAGIDVEAWDPEKGAAANEEIIKQVYRYYGDLYLENADLQWAGMANMIGPSFAGGFLDLSMIRDWAKAVEKYAPPGRFGELEHLRTLASLTDDDLKFYEVTLLGMQKDIFRDQGTMHEAYRQGGMKAIRELYESGALDRATYESWKDIHSGDPARVEAGNEQFLLREQKQIIDAKYLEMYDHPVTGQVVTWGMTQIGKPSIPGAKSFPELHPLVVPVETPGTENIGVPFTPWQTDNPLQGTVWVETPFAHGNVAQFDDRWKLITEDTLPKYQQLLREDPDLARALIAADVGGRVEEYRLKNTIDDILRQLATDWEVDRVEQ